MGKLSRGNIGGAGLCLQLLCMEGNISDPPEP